MDESVLDIDGLTTEELRSLEFGRQVDALNDLIGECGRLAKTKCLAIDVLADSRMKAITEPTPKHKATVVDAKRKLDKIGVAITARKQQASILQSIVRGVPH